MNANPTTTNTAIERPSIADRFSASLYITGDGLDLEGISKTLGVTPTQTRRKGGHKAHWDDLWKYQAPVAREKPLDEHIKALWDAIRPQIPYLLELKKKFRIEVGCCYVSCWVRGNINIDHRCLGLFEELGIPLRIATGISFDHMIAHAESAKPTTGGFVGINSWIRRLARRLLAFLH